MAKIAALALAILAGSFAVLHQYVSVGLRAADDARSLTRAQLFAESTLAEMTSGAVLPADTSGTLPDDPTWRFEVAMAGAEQPGLVRIEIIVYKQTALGIGANYRLAKLMRDPSMEIPVDETATDDSTGSSTSTSTSESG